MLTARRSLSLPVAGTPPLVTLNAVTANGQGQAFSLQRAFSNWEVQIQTTGSPAAFSVQLMGCLDGVNFVAIGSAVTTTGLTSVTSNTPLTNVRADLSGLSGGTSPTVTVTMAGTEAPAGSGGGGGGGAVTIANGADTAEGSTTDAKVTGDNNGTVSAKLRGLLYEFGDQADAAAAADNSTASFMAFFKRLLARLTTLLPQTGGRLSVDGSGVTQPVSGTTTSNQGTANTAANSWPVEVTDGTNVLGVSAHPLRTDPTGTTPQPVSGTVTANQGTAAAASGAWPAKVTDGTNVAAVKAASTAAVATDSSAVVALSPNSALPAGTNTAGNVGGISAPVNATLTRPANTTTYTANTAVANATSAASQITFSNAGTRSGGSGFVIGATLVDEANQTLKGQFELWLFDTTLGTITNDNANWAPANADLANLVGIIKFDSGTVGNNAAGASGNVVFTDTLSKPLPYKCNGSANLFGQLVVRNAYVPVSAEVFVLRLELSQDA